MGNLTCTIKNVKVTWKCLLKISRGRGVRVGTFFIYLCFLVCAFVCADMYLGVMLILRDLRLQWHHNVIAFMDLDEET